MNRAKCAAIAKRRRWNCPKFNAFPKKCGSENTNPPVISRDPFTLDLVVRPTILLDGCNSPKRQSLWRTTHIILTRFKFAVRIDRTNAARKGDRDRIEFQHQPEPPGTAEGTERYFGWSVFLPKKLTDEGHSMGYFETRNSWRQLMSFEARGEDLVYSTRVPYARHWTGKEKLTAGRWHDFAIHVLWSRDPDKGFVEVWFDGEQVVPRTKTATLLDENVAFFQFGLMRATSEVPETIIFDSVIEATSLEEIAPPPQSEILPRAGSK